MRIWQSRKARWSTAAAAVGIGVVLGAAGIASAAGTAASSTAVVSPQVVASDGPSAGQPPRGHRRGGPGGVHGPFGAALHGTFVVPDGNGGYSTMQLWRGKVTAVSPSSITVQSEDAQSQTFSVTASTRVNAARDGIGSVAVGHAVVVFGRGATSPVAVRIEDRKSRAEGQQEMGPAGS